MYHLRAADQSHLEQLDNLRRMQGIPDERILGRPFFSCGLRVKDVDFERKEITTRDAKGSKERVALLPSKVAGPLAAHPKRVRQQHEAVGRIGGGR